MIPERERVSKEMIPDFQNAPKHLRFVAMVNYFSERFNFGFLVYDLLFTKIYLGVKCQS